MSDASTGEIATGSRKTAAAPGRVETSGATALADKVSPTSCAIVWLGISMRRCSTQLRSNVTPKAMITPAPAGNPTRARVQRITYPTIACTA